MTLILAKIFGIYFFSIGLAFLINPNSLRKMCRITDESILFIGGILALIIGAIVVALHNHWVFNRAVIITILGWWSLVKGLVILTYPEPIKLISFIQNRSDTTYRLISVFCLFVGLFFLFVV